MGCHSTSQPRSCRVNEDCSQGEQGRYEYCDGQAVLAASFYDGYFSCYQGAAGVCKPVDDSTDGAPCATNDDCKSYRLACLNQSCVDDCGASLGGEPVLCDETTPCPNPDALPPDVAIVRCPAGCRAGTRNWTCRGECFCPTCPATIDGAADSLSI